MKALPSCVPVAKATALEVAVLALHLLLYPTGVTQERRVPCRDGGAGGLVAHDDGAQGDGPGDDGSRSPEPPDHRPPGHQAPGHQTADHRLRDDRPPRGRVRHGTAQPGGSPHEARQQGAPSHAHPPADRGEPRHEHRAEGPAPRGLQAQNLAPQGREARDRATRERTAQDFAVRGLGVHGRADRDRTAQAGRGRAAQQGGDREADDRPPAPGTGGPGGRPPQWAPPPVVLLHGLVDNRSVFVLLRRALGRGRHVEALNYSPLTCDLRTAARQLARHVEDVCARTGHRRVDLVGHSLGGLVARYYVQRLGGDERIRTVVTLGTPHSGTVAVPLAGLHPLVRQMRPDSPVLRELAGPAPGCRTRFVSFWSGLDHWMAPAESARLHHPDLTATNVEVIGIGHLALPVHPAVSARVREELDAWPSTAASGGSASVSVA